jgi:hypothetical protein
MKKIFIGIILIVFISLMGMGVLKMINQEEQRLLQAVQNHININGDSYVTLAELLDFEWEKALYFRFPATRQEIEQSIGATYTGETDLVAGIIFVKNGEVVYYELFSGAFDGFANSPPELSFNPQISQNDNTNIRIFSHEDEFEIKLTDSENYWMGWLR